MPESKQGGDGMKNNDEINTDIEVQTASKRRELLLKRELNRIRSSISFRLGLHLTKAIRHPWRLPFLIFSVPYIMFILGLEMVGLRPTVASNSIIEQDAPPRNCIVFFPTNGVGFGHFTRMFAVAQRYKKKDPNCEIISVSYTHLTLPTILRV